MIIISCFTFLNGREGYRIIANILEIAHNIQAILYMCFIPQLRASK